MKLADLDDTRIEAKILYYMQKVHTVSLLIQKLQPELDQHRTRLRLLIDMFKTRAGQTGVDDLVAAVIKDNALPLEDIMFCFSFDEDIEFRQCIKRINIRNESKL